VTFPAAIILAAKGDDFDVGKIIFFVIAAIIWGVGALASSLNKQKEQARRRQVAESLTRTTSGPPPIPIPPAVRVGSRVQPRIPRPAPPRPVPPRIQPPRPVQQVPRMVAPPPPRQPKKASRRAGPRVPLPAPVPLETLVPLPESPAEPSVVGREIRATDRSIPRQSAGAAVNAAALNRWLAPATLRTQFILTEVLQPPVAMRQSSEW
jgi:hypothetical protein